MTTMYKIFDVPADPLAKVNLLAIMPMSTIQKVFALHTSASLRILQETKNNGICQLFFRREFPGFGMKVIIQEFDPVAAMNAAFSI